jgi:hypothetical protein
MIFVQRRRQHFKTITDGATSVAAEPGDRIEPRRINALR